MGEATSSKPVAPSLSIVGLLAWILPGLGHWYLGHRVRGVTIMVVLAATFWCGVAIGGVKSTVDPKENRIWFLAQICAGSHTIVSAIWSRQLSPVVYRCPNCRAELSDDSPSGVVCGRCQHRIPRIESARQLRLAFWPQVDIAIVYTGIAGLLNVLVVLDALARAEIEPLERAANGGTAHG